MIDDEEISFKFSIYKAEVMLDRAKCDPDTQFTPDKTALVERKLSEAETQVHLNGGVGGVKHGHKWKSSYQFSKTDEALTIESCGSPKVPLRGQLLDEFVGWRVKPHLGVNSGVLGRVRVREDWIELVEPEHHAGPRRIFDKMWAYLTGEGNDAESRRKKFSALLARLVSEALQDVAEMRDATLAMDTIIVRPEDEVALRLEGVPAPLLQLEGTEIDKYLGGQEVPAIPNPADSVSHRLLADVDAEIGEVLERYFAELGDLTTTSMELGEYRVHGTVLLAISPKGWKHIYYVRPMSLASQHRLNILMRRRPFEDFITSGQSWKMRWHPDLRSTNQWLNAIDNGYGKYDIRIGEYLTMRYSDVVYAEYFERKKQILADAIRTLQHNTHPDT
ncbi:MAG: hypothetical protein ABJZ83_11870 [Yoonia sp.]